MKDRKLLFLLLNKEEYRRGIKGDWDYPLYTGIKIGYSIRKCRKQQKNFLVKTKVEE
jgi:hypothetical protein